MPDRYRSLLLFGGPGVGKGTQGALLGRIPGFHHLSTGDMFRKLDKTSKLGRTFVEISSRGELVPDELTIKLWEQEVGLLIREGDYNPARDVLVLDGIPRSVVQCELMADKIDVRLVAHLACANREAIFERLRNRALKQGRADDAKEEVVKRRWEVYEAETAPVLGYYDDALIHEIEAEGHPARVLWRLLGEAAPLVEANVAQAMS